MSQTDLPKNILNEILNIFSISIDRTAEGLIFSSMKLKQKKASLVKQFPKINFLEQKKGISYETNSLYESFIVKLTIYIERKNEIYFDFSIVILYFQRIINYLKELNESNIDIVEDDLVKIFFYLLFLFLDSHCIQTDPGEEKYDLDETFFKGTFIELTEKYGIKKPYEDSEEIKNYIDKHKKIMIEKISSIINITFQKMIYRLREKCKKTDDLIINMTTDVSNILYAFDKSEVGLSDDLINKIRNFYSKEEYLILANYFSETEYEDLKEHIDRKFLETIKEKYSPFEFNYKNIQNTTSACNHKKNLDDYIEMRNKFYKRMKYSSLHEILKYNLNDEINIFALSNYYASTDFGYIQKYIKGIENLDQKNIIQIIKEILNENDFYEFYFSILKSDIIKNFFTSDLITDENVQEFLLLKKKSKDSENFSNAYSEFLKQYDKKSNDYNEFKNLIFLKILPSGDRAYTLRHFKKIIINPVQFFLGEEIKDEINIKKILKGYLMVILLHETEHFLRALDKSNNVFPRTPRNREGGRMFIKYIFGVLSINHINLDQANSIFRNDNWNGKGNLKTIFKEQLEDIEEDNINEFLLNYFKNSISFFSTGSKKLKKKSNSYLDLHFRK